MICTVTFNPSLDYIVTVDNFRLGRTNRTSSERLLPGGKGINVSMELGNLGLDSTALGFASGFTGDELIREVRAAGVNADFIQVEKGLTRVNLKLRSIEGTEINGNGPEIDAAALERLLGKLDRLGEGDILVLAGSIPASVPGDIYEQILERLRGRGILTVVDATRGLLMNVLSYQPFLVKPNHHELGELFGVELTARSEVVPYAARLRERGARNVLVSLAGEGAVLLAENGETYEAPAPDGTLVNSVGAGDSMVAGFLAGWLECRDYRHALRMGVAAGSASAFSEQLATRAQIDEVYARTVVSAPASSR